jgi:CRISPR/Cas system-associated exonuclease Cas4 (RecB family)
VPHVDTIIDGVKYPSVTEILGCKPKPWLDAWFDKWGVLARRKVICANGIGTKFHLYAERLAKGELVLPPSNRRLRGMLVMLDAWIEGTGFKLKESELHVVSEAYKYAGTFDATGFLPDRPRTLTLFDWKTSSGIYPDMALQLSAYGQAYKEMTGIEIKRGFIVHVSKEKPDHKMTVKEYELTKPLFNKFLKRLEEYRKVNA